MKYPHFNSCKSVELCKPQAHPNTYGNSPQIAPRPSRLILLVATVCAAVHMPASVYAQSNHDLIPSTEEEILRDAIDTPSDFDISNDARGGNFCQIVLVNDGALHEIPGTYKLSSKGAGGRSGAAQVTTTNGSYRVTIDQPLGFMNAPAGGNSGVLMQASFSGRGASNFSETPGDVSQKLKRGTTDIEAHLVAERTNNTPFPAGNYSAELTLRCE